MLWIRVRKFHANDRRYNRVQIGYMRIQQLALTFHKNNVLVEHPSEHDAQASRILFIYFWIRHRTVTFEWMKHTLLNYRPSLSHIKIWTSDHTGLGKESSNIVVTGETLTLIYDLPLISVLICRLPTGFVWIYSLLIASVWVLSLPRHHSVNLRV